MSETLSAISTKKQARNSGLKTRREWMKRGNKTGRRRMTPVVDATPVTVKDEDFFSIDCCEEIISPTEGNDRRLVLKDDAENVLTMHAHFGKSVEYHLYRLSDFRLARQRNEVPPVEVDLLLAIFTVNKSAKRYRDAARKSYEAHAHQFATVGRQRKERLYALKDRGISHALSIGRLAYTGMHGGLATYRGDGYCFHSTLVPKGADAELSDCDEPIFVASAPRVATDVRLKDAEFTLENCCVNEELFVRSEIPKHRTRYSSPADAHVYDDEWNECEDFDGEFDGYE